MMSRVKWKRSFLATICAVGVMATGILPKVGTVVQAAGDKEIVYTQMSRGVTDSSGDGTEGNPYNRLEDAVDNVADGGTIYVLGGNGAFLNTQDEYGSVPYVIGKNVTIEAAPGVGMANLSVRAGGIVLGGNVTFRNIGLGFANKYHDSIFANGHTLVLDNVSRNSGTRLVDLFAGGLYGTDGSVLGTSSAGDGTIILRGSGEFGNIYAGSMNGAYSGNVSISIESRQNLEGTIYGSGAKEPELQDNNWFDMTEPPAPEADAASYPVNGNTDIQLADISVRAIEGAGTTGDVNVTLGTNYPSDIALEHISGLTVTNGRIIPTALTEGTSGQLDLDIRSGSALELTNVPGKTVRNFTGGGTLVLAKTDTLTITGNVTGQTKFLVAGGLQDKSGSALAEHVYIRGNGTADNFTFEPADTQKGMTLEYQAGAGEWKTSTIKQDFSVYADSFKFAKNKETLEYDAVNGTGQLPKLQVNWTASAGSVYQMLEQLPIRYEIQHNGKLYKAETEEDEDGNYRGRITELHMELIGYNDIDGQAVIEVGNIQADQLPVEEGIYTITAFVPKADGTEISSTIEVTVMDSKAVRYSVRYFQQNADDDKYTEVKADAEEQKRGVAGADAEITTKNYTGFEDTPIVKYSDSAHQTESTDALKVNGDNSLQVSVYYNRKTYQLSYKTSGIPEGTSGAPEDPKAQQNVRFGQTVQLADKLKFDGWTMSDWYSNDIILTGKTFQMPMKDVLIQAKWTNESDKPVKANVKYSAQGEPVNLEINGVQVVPPEGEDASSYNTQVTFKSDSTDKNVRVRMGVLFAYEFKRIEINGTDYSKYIPTTEEELLAAFKDQQTWVEFDVPVDAKDTYEVVTVTEQASKYAVGNFLWTYDENQKYVKDANGNDVLNDDYIENGSIELVAVQYGGITYSGKELEEHLQKGTAFDWGEKGKNGEAVLPAGAIVTVKLTPDYGYQLTSFGINGGTFDARNEDSTFSFEIKGGNFHLGARFTKVDNRVQSTTDTITGGSVNVSEGTVKAGTVVLSVEDAAVSETEKQAFAKIGNTEYKVTDYLDLNLNQVLYKGTDDGENVWSNPLGKIAELKEDAEITLKLKDARDESSVVLHEKHDGTYEVIQPQYNVEEQTLTFKTKGFSKYAIATVEKENVNPDKKPDQKDEMGNDNSKNDKTTVIKTVKNVITKTVRTGDQAPIWILMALLIVCAGVVVLMIIRKRKK